jgi:hypothetical protein
MDNVRCGCGACDPNGWCPYVHSSGVRCKEHKCGTYDWRRNHLDPLERENPRGVSETQVESRGGGGPGIPVGFVSPGRCGRTKDSYAPRASFAPLGLAAQTRAAISPMAYAMG